MIVFLNLFIYFIFFRRVLLFAFKTKMPRVRPLLVEVPLKKKKRKKDENVLLQKKDKRYDKYLDLCPPRPREPCIRPSCARPRTDTDLCEKEGWNALYAHTRANTHIHHLAGEKKRVGPREGTPLPL